MKLLSQSFHIPVMLACTLLMNCSEGENIIADTNNQSSPPELEAKRPNLADNCDSDELLEDPASCAEDLQTTEPENQFVTLFKKKSLSSDSTVPTQSKTNGNTSTTTSTAAELTSDSVNFDSFCSDAASIKSLANAGLKSLFGEICQGETPTLLLSKELIAKAYRGDGQIKFHTIRPLSSNGRNETSIRIAFAFLLPVTAKDYFDRIAPQTLQPEGLKEIIEGSGGTGTISIERNFSNDGPHHERGALANQKLVKTVRGFQVTVQSVARYDQHSLTIPTAYLNTSRIEQAISGIIATDSIVAIIQQGQQAYYLQLWDIVTPNRGRPEIAEAELARTVVTSANALYKRINRQASN